MLWPLPGHCEPFGWLHLPHSVTRSAYGVIPIPIAVVKNGMGPQVLLTGGTHGDEYEGQIALTRLVQSLAQVGCEVIRPTIKAPS